MRSESEGRECDDAAEKRKKVDRLVYHLETVRGNEKEVLETKEWFPTIGSRSDEEGGLEFVEGGNKKEMMSIVKMGTFIDLQSRKEWKGKAPCNKIVLTIKYQV